MIEFHLDARSGVAPTTGTIEVLGGRPAAGPAQLARVGYLAQDAPVYAGLSVAGHLKLGAHLNRAGTVRWRAAGSADSTWTPARSRARCPAVSAPSSR